MTALFTLGYQGRSPESFIGLLKKNGIMLVIDVRGRTATGVKGFSKNQLQAHLTRNRILYLHFKELGPPAEIKKELKKTQNYPLFFRKYLSHLGNQTGTLAELVKEAEKQTAVCLIGYQRNPLQCHRNVITDYLSVKYPNSFYVNHL